MLKRYGGWLAFLLLLVVIVGQSLAIANEQDHVEVNRSEVFETVKKGYEAQAAIRGKQLSMTVMYKQLSPYFTDEFLQVFTDENSVDTKASGSYLLAKTAPFSFTSETKLVHDREHRILYVYEHLAATGKYEIVSLRQVKEQWKLAGYHGGDELLADIVALEKASK